MCSPLPPDIRLPNDFVPDKIGAYISELKVFLASPLVKALVLAHPNEIAIQGKWTLSDVEVDDDWWSWAGTIKPNIQDTIISALIDSAVEKDVPKETSLHRQLDVFIHAISRLRLPRNMDSDLDNTSALRKTLGLSPKKAHEVERLSSLIDRTYESIKCKNRLIVDVGAGQGYLSHRLAEIPGTRVLALDGDEGQTEGASLRGQGLSHAQRQRARQTNEKNGELQEQAVTHRTLFITSESLLDAVDNWIAGLGLEKINTPYPVLVTGLHACGSLTPAVLRCFVDLFTSADESKTWRPSALALVGCCYNLMRDPDDFPLSSTTRTTFPAIQIYLTPNHLQLAAQCPAQWSRSQPERERAALARRKIVWRALLARLLYTKSITANRLGRLPDRVYTSWKTFTQTACSKMGVQLPKAEFEKFDTDTEVLAFQVELLHVLRALIGPVIESMIIVDRAMYLAERVASRDSEARVRALNVFDQLSSGSARNIALVVESDSAGPN